jgi:ABC-type Zn uptake system ZnuABC Zn-binding protein ZnuA
MAAAAANFLSLAATARGASPVPVLAAENFYGDVAAQIGDRDVTASSILSNPDGDPHLFEVSPSVARREGRRRRRARCVTTRLELVAPLASLS